MPVAHGDERQWRSSIADRVEDETHRMTEPTGETRRRKAVVEGFHRETYS